MLLHKMRHTYVSHMGCSCTVSVYPPLSWVLKEEKNKKERKERKKGEINRVITKQQMYRDDRHPRLYNLAAGHTSCTVLCRAYYMSKCHYFLNILLSCNGDICEPIFVCDPSLVQLGVVFWGAPVNRVPHLCSCRVN